MTDVNVVIIGGGAMGCSLLYHLAKAGWSDIVLVEKNDLTHGSTWHAAGLCTHFAHNPTIQELRATSVRLYRDILPEETGESCGFHRSGAMRVTELHPLATLDGLLGGIYEPDDGHVDPSLATNAMAKQAQRHGAVIQRYNPVHAIRHENGRWVVETKNGTLRARHIVNAAGTWGFEIGRMMGVNVPSVPVLHQYLVTDTVPAIAERQKAGAPELPIIRDPEESWYCRQERDGFILGPYEKQAQVWSPDGVPPDFGAELMAPDLDRVEHIIKWAMARVPALATAGIKTVVNGPITFTPDANPLIGPAHGAPNAWLLTGSSMGIMEGGGAGKFLAHWMTHCAPPMDALAVDSRRFGPWADRSYRVDKAIECFGLQFGVHYPFEERPAARNIRTSALHDVMLERGAVMGAAHGAERPNWFSATPHGETRDSFRRTNWFDAVAREVEAVTTRVAIADLSVFSKFDVTGPDALRFLAALGSNVPPRPGRIGLTHALTPAGGVASEFTVSVLAPDHAYLNSAAAAEEMDLDLLTARAEGFDVTIANRTNALAVLGLMGPRSADVLATLAGLDGMAWLNAREIKVAGIPARVLRVSYVGEKGYELHVDRAHAGRPFGIGHYGAYAANSMRLEKGYRGWGMDLTTERSPLETGLSYLVKYEGRSFIGREAMLKRQPGWDMVLLEIDTDGAVEPVYSHTLFAAGRPVGVVTSGAFGHRVRKSLALAFLRERDMREGLAVKLLGVERPARILAQPPYDPQNLKLKA